MVLIVGLAPQPGQQSQPLLRICYKARSRVLALCAQQELHHRRANTSHRYEHRIHIRILHVSRHTRKRCVEGGANERRRLASHGPAPAPPPPSLAPATPAPR
ncbi:hypothetical protein HMPREF1317_0562 [Schaalia georgiae F0490]|uniref:Uncharacterized protein n=1 Tax=Schaalia georgiae F0490 TaxID=1125717 RepID=J0WZ86_9ACTO|nr:hypothetical protein HMPREF1317_0562 [Schaalia georgiae F0490]